MTQSRYFVSWKQKQHERTKDCISVPQGKMPARWSVSYKTLVTKGRWERRRQRQRRWGSERRERREWRERFSEWLRKQKRKRKKSLVGSAVCHDLMRGALSCWPWGGNPLSQVGSGRPAFPTSHSIHTWSTWAMGSLSVASLQSHLILFSLSETLSSQPSWQTSPGSQNTRPAASKHN